MDGGRISKTLISGYPADASTNPNDYVQKLNGNETKIGASILLKVMAGDKITVKATSRFNNWITPGTPVSPVTDIVNALTNSLPPVSGGKLLKDQLGSTILSGSVNGFLNNRNGGNNASRPKAWFNVVVLDEQLNAVITSDGKNSYFQQVGASNVFTTHSITDREITRNGYVYIFVSNETPNLNVYFDNLQVTHTRGPVLQEAGYYPFGLEMQGISSSAGTSLANNYKFNAGTLLEERFDVNLYETPFRRYDAQIGRFTGVDILAEFTPDFTPYQYGANDPVFWNDPTGLLIGNPWYNKLGIPRSFDLGDGGNMGENSGGFNFGGMSPWGWVGYNTGSYAPTGFGGAGSYDGSNGAGDNGGYSRGGGGVYNTRGSGHNEKGDDDYKKSKTDWQPFYKSDLIRYMQDEYDNDNPTEKELGDEFEDIFSDWFTTKRKIASELANFRKNSDTWQGGDRNTKPDFSSDIVITGTNERIIQGSAYEVKQNNGKGIYLSSNNGQVKGHILNLLIKHLAAISAGIHPTFTLVTTADVPYSRGINAFAKERSIIYYHMFAQYKINKKGDYKFRFVQRFSIF